MSGPETAPDDEHVGIDDTGPLEAEWLKLHREEPDPEEERHFLVALDFTHFGKEQHFVRTLDKLLKWLRLSHRVEIYRYVRVEDGQVHQINFPPPPDDPVVEIRGGEDGVGYAVHRSGAQEFVFHDHEMVTSGPLEGVYIGCPVPGCNWGEQVGGPVQQESPFGPVPSATVDPPEVPGAQ